MLLGFLLICVLPGSFYNFFYIILGKNLKSAKIDILSYNITYVDKSFINLFAFASAYFFDLAIIMKAI